jgi:adenine-specific DNA-methyltransferase
MVDLLLNNDNDSINHVSHNKDVFDLLDINGLSDIQVAYIDSPYNERKYSGNYHVLEVISKYNYPNVKGKTGLLQQENNGAKAFCSRVNAAKSFETMLQKLNTQYVFISYSSESIVSKEAIQYILKKTGWIDVVCVEKEYKRFKSNKNGKQEKTVKEYLFCAKRFN